MSDSAELYVRGKGQFLDDLQLPGLLHLKIVRSPYARARLVSVRGPGAITAAELDVLLPATGEGGGGSPEGIREPALARDRVSYAGQGVAAVVESSASRAEDALEAVDVEYEPERPVVDPSRALEAGPIHSSLGSNLMAEYELGRPFAPPADAVHVDSSYTLARVAANPMETRGALARWENGRFTLWASSQSVFSLRRGLAETFGLPSESVRVIQTDTGGGFGSKGALYPEYVVAAYAARTRGRPVKWSETRREHLSAARPGRGSAARVELFADRRGRIHGLRSDLLVDGGAFVAGLNASSPRFIGFQMSGPYAIPRAFVRARAVYTNKVPLGPYRGAGRPDAAFFIERAMDELADELGLDPFELRFRNASAEVFRSPLGTEVEPLRPFLETARRELDYVPPAPGEGIGFSSFLLVPAFAPGEGARLDVRGPTLHVWLGSHAHGQGHERFVRRLLQEELGVEPARVVLEKPDTDAIGRGIGTWGSRSAMVGGAALVRAARRLRSEVEAEQGKYTVEQLFRRDRSVTLFEPQEGQLNPLGANLVRATVDALGFVAVEEVRSYYDVGRALDRPTIEGQITGGAVQALGQSLSESLEYDAEGRLETASLPDAGVLPSVVSTEFRAHLAENRSRLPHGVKGVGEAPTVGVPPALARAIERATGRRVRETPVRPWQLVGPRSDSSAVERRALRG